MHSANGERGTTILEALVAASLLIGIVSGVASLIVLTHRFAVRAEQMTVATVAASSRLERLRAVPWEYDLAGLERDAPALEISPPGALEHSVAGFHESLDAAGRPLAAPLSAEPAYVRRWAIVPLDGVGAFARAFEVCVFVWPAAGAARPLVCLATVRTRQP